MRNLNKKKIALLTACVVSAVGHMAFAAEADNYDEYNGADYVVTATKTQLEKKEVPQSVEVITQEDIKNTAAYNVRDALRFATNIDVQEVGMTGNVAMVLLCMAAMLWAALLTSLLRKQTKNTQASVLIPALKKWVQTSIILPDVKAK